MRQANAAEALLALWDPASNTLVDLTSLAPQVFQNGVGVIARSGDHARVLVASNDVSGSAKLLDGNAAILTSPKSMGTGTLLYAAGNPDGSRFAAVLNSGNSEQLVLLDSSLNVLSTIPVSAARGLVFFHDGKSLYVAEDQNGVSLLSILSAADLHSFGAAADVAIQESSSEVEEAGETNLVFGLNNRWSLQTLARRACT